MYLKVSINKMDPSSSLGCRMPQGSIDTAVTAAAYDEEKDRRQWQAKEAEQGPKAVAGQGG